jgi:hypothetical protein
MNWKSRVTTTKRALLAATAIVTVSTGSAIAGGATPETMSVNLFQIQGSWTNFEPSKSARRYALECIDCDDTTNIADEDFVISHESDFQDMTGAMKFFNVLSPVNDMAFGLSGGMFTTETNRFAPSYTNDGSIGTPYGTVDSSSSGDGASNQDKANFLTGDFEYGWRNSSASQTLGLDNLNTRWFVGARAEILNWKRTAVQDLSSSNLYAGDEKSEFFGIGPRIGGSFDQPLGATKRFGLFGGLSGGAMYGRREQSFSLSSASTADGDLPGDSDTVVVPFLDAEIGVTAYVNEGITLQFGYQAGFTSGIIRNATVCTDNNADDVKPYNDSCGDKSSDTLTHGAVIRLTGTF